MGSIARPWIRRARLALLLALSCASTSAADEFSILTTSTVLGQNFGYPTGTPVQGNTPPQRLGLVMETAFFFKNHELLGLEDIDGETFFGFFFPLRLRYRADDRLTIEVGGLLGQNYGDENSLDVASPLVRLGYEPTDDLFLIAGTLFPTHWIHDGLLDDVQRFRENPELGLQFRADRHRWKNDLWINWRVREGDLAAEEFEIANSSQLRLFDSALRADAHFIWVHAGGQKSASTRLEDNMSVLAGLSYGFGHPFGLDFVEDARAGGRYMYSSDDTKEKPRETGQGWEAFGRIDLRARHNISVHLTGAYYRGYDYFARRGDPLYWLDEYYQFGVSSIFELVDGLHIEAGIVRQVTDGEGNFSYLVNFVWGHDFVLPTLRDLGLQKDRE